MFDRERAHQLAIAVRSLGAPMLLWTGLIGIAALMVVFG